jgi:hypothetical protein
MLDLKFWLDEFDAAKFDEGEAAFSRGVSIGQFTRQVRVELRDPNVGAKGSSAAQARWHTDQIKRESNARGLILGYLNGLAQATRRIDQQLMNQS